MDADYLKESVGDVLARGLADIVLTKPSDPIEFLGQWILQERQNSARQKEDRLEAERLEIERAAETKRLEEQRLLDAAELEARRMKEQEQVRLKTLKRNQQNYQRSQEYLLKVEIRKKELEKVEEGLKGVEVAKKHLMISVADLNEMDKGTADELRGMDEAPANFRKVIKGILYMLGYQKHNVQEWQQCQEILKHDDFLKSLIRYNPAAEKKINRLKRAAVATSGLDRSEVQRSSVAATMLYNYLESAVDLYNETLHIQSPDVAAKEAVKIGATSDEPREDGDIFQDDSEPGVLELCPVLDTKKIPRESAGQRLTISLGWKNASKERPVDLDAACVMFNDVGAVWDTVYYNQLKSKDGSITHCGDDAVPNKDKERDEMDEVAEEEEEHADEGEEGGEEKLVFELDKVPLSIRALGFVLFSVKEDQSFAQVDSVSGQIAEADSGKDVGLRFTSPCGIDSTAVLMCILYRDPNNASAWMCKAVGETVEGQSEIGLNFMTTVPLLSYYLDILTILDPAAKRVRKAADAANMDRGEFVSFSSNPGILRLKMRWHVLSGKMINVGSTLIAYEHRKKVDVVNLDAAENEEESIMYMSDKDEGSNDDFLLDFTKMHRADSLLVVVNCFHGGTFRDVEGLNLRLVSEDSGAELCSFTLPSAHRDENNGLIFAKIYKEKGVWSALAIGTPSAGSNYEDLLPEIRKYLPAPAKKDVKRR